jgi:L-fucose mutarotase
MLIGIDPLLNPDVLHALAAMGHGDEIALVDANFPAESTAAGTFLGAPLRIAADTPGALKAILSVLPLDSFVAAPVSRMQVVGAPEDVPPVMRAAQEVVDHAAGKSLPMEALERFAFYERASACFAIVVTTERRFYGNVLIRKGVIGPEAQR